MTHDCTFLTDLDLADDQISFGTARREAHATDWGTDEDDGIAPDAVVWPESTADVSAVLAAAQDHDVPVTPYAAGTSLEGNPVPVEAGISLDVTRMDAVLDVRPDSFQVDVQPGLLGAEVNEAVSKHGLYFPPLPSSGDISTVGGLIANDASGMKTVKYGEIGDWILELEVVRPDGEVMTLGSKAAKTSSGYNLKDLVIGSEGTLGVVTRATLELTGRPEQIRGGRAIFESLDDASEAIFDAVRSGVDVATIELIDTLSARISNNHLGTDLPDAPMVFVEFHANHSIENEIDFCRSIFADHDVERFEIADDEQEMTALWEARKELAEAIDPFEPDLEQLTPGDVTVPIEQYPTMVQYIKDLADEYDLLIPTFGHAGDGNIHYAILVDRDDPDSVARGKEAYTRVVEQAIEYGGTSTGEHGIGVGKRAYMVDEHGEATVETMRAVKRAFDPNGILNPGKIFPEDVD